MKKSRRAPWLVLLVSLLALVALPSVALAGRSGGSFGGRMGFRSGGGSSFSMPRSSGGGYGRSYGGGSNFVFLPGFGFGGYGMGGGGFGFFGTIMLMAVAGLAVASVVRAVRRHREARGGAWYADEDDDRGPVAMPGRAYLYKLQIALGRSARGIQDRLAEFAERGDTSTEAGLAALMQQTALELLREKDSIRYVRAEATGPMSLTNAETGMNGAALAERSRFQVERVRASDGRVNRSTVAAEEGKEALELVVVTLVVATRAPLEAFKRLTSSDHASVEDVAAALSALGGTPPDGLLGLEVVWTPADANDSMTETDVMTTYPELRGV